METTTMTTFRFDVARHEYIDLASGLVLPHITGMLEDAGYVDDRWFTEESANRGHVVHRLTADYDLGVHGEDVSHVISKYVGYLHAHVEAMKIIRPTWNGIEEPRVYSTPKWGGRIDRDGIIYQALSVCEIKTGPPEHAHEVQTALQAILLVDGSAMPADAVMRYVLYLKPNGKFKLERHENRRDFDKARDVIRRYARS